MALANPMYLAGLATGLARRRVARCGICNSFVVSKFPNAPFPKLLTSASTLMALTLAHALVCICAIICLFVAFVRTHTCAQSVAILLLALRNTTHPITTLCACD